MGHVQRRLRIVQDIDSFDVSSGAIADQNLSSKLLLLHPNVVNDPESRQKWQDAFQFVASQQHSELSASTATTTLVYGPSVSVRLRPKDYTVSYVLSKLLPAEIGMPPTSFETVGHVAHLNLPETFMPHRHLIGEVLLECLSSSSLIRTVICKTDSVAGPYRTYDFEIVAGDPTTVVRHVEHGVNLFFDVQKVYWSSRLSQERKRLVSAFRPGQVIADAFCGVGALCLQASKLGCVVLANDWNPDAIESLQRNARRNRAKLSDVRCGDAYEFLMDLGLSSGGDLPDHVVMNYPLEAPRFLGALRWWRPSSTNHDSARTGGGPRLHVYTFARAEGSRTAEDEAVEAISSHLVYGPTPNSEGTRLSRAAELEEYGCNIHVHFVRDVAPGKKVFCVSFTATPKLLRYMQGDFS
jgi:tRNA (guanine37-N1)-methyltransferase